MNRRWLIGLALLVVVLLGAGLFFFLPASLDPVRASASQPTGRALVARGAYLATAGDCVACHTAPGGRGYAGGLPFKLPFGTIYSSNITPDRESGIGGWSDAEFVRAMRHGVRKDGQQLYPAFPYTSYTRMSTDDALAIRAFLNTLPPVHQTVQPNGLSFPFNQRWLMRGWNLLFMPKHQLRDDASQSAEWNRGRYLVEALGHCGECHTPRNLIYGYQMGRKFAGETTQGWKAYNITSDRTSGIGDWSVQEIATYMQTGHAEGRGAASGSMAEAVEKSLSHLQPADLRAMAVYLKTVPPKGSGHGEAVNANPPALAASSPYAPGSAEADTLGRHIFEGACASCHAWNGQGLQTPYAALRGAQSVNDPEAINVMQVILRGSDLHLGSTHVFMPAFGEAYSNTEIAAVSNYVLGHFGGKRATVTPEHVARARKQGE